MTKPRAEIERPDARIGARLETLAYLFDVSVQTVLNAVAAHKIEPSREVFGVPLYHVKTVEQAVFGGVAVAKPVGEEEDAGEGNPDEGDPYLKGVRALAAREKGRKSGIAA